MGEIRYGAAGKNAATLIGYYVPGAKLVKLTGRKTATVDVVLGKKFTSLASSQTVKSAENAAAKRC